MAAWDPRWRPTHTAHRWFAATVATCAGLSCDDNQHSKRQSARASNDLLTSFVHWTSDPPPCPRRGEHLGGRPLRAVPPGSLRASASCSPSAPRLWLWTRPPASATVSASRRARTYRTAILMTWVSALSLVSAVSSKAGTPSNSTASPTDLPDATPSWAGVSIVICVVERCGVAGAVQSPYVRTQIVFVASAPPAAPAAAGAPLSAPPRRRPIHTIRYSRTVNSCVCSNGLPLRHTSWHRFVSHLVPCLSAPKITLPLAIYGTTTKTNIHYLMLFSLSSSALQTIRRA